MLTGAITSLRDLGRAAPRDGERFADRRDAGRQLAPLTERFRGEQPVVVGMARGGVPVAAEVADALGAPMDVVVVRKIGAPDEPEFALGALAEAGVRVIADDVVAALGIRSDELDALVARQQRELDARLARYRGNTPPLPVQGRTVLLVDDGLATGRSARAAARSLRARGAERIVFAVPVAARQPLGQLRDVVDEVVCVEAPADLWAVGGWYRDFRPTSDAEVVALLEARRATATPTERDVAIETGLRALLPGDLALPAAPCGIVAFAHGSGSSRRSSRNQSVARALNDAGIATLLFDLLTPAEEVDRDNVFDIDLLAARLLAANRFLHEQDATRHLPLGYFGASTGAAAALIAAAEAGTAVRAVVSRGGRPDLAAQRLPDVVAPTLLIVGGDDRGVLDLNRQALARMRCERDLAIVPGATHLFEEPGALSEVARLAVAWFIRHLDRR